MTLKTAPLKSKHYVFGCKTDAENMRAMELFKKMNAVCDNEEWIVVMTAVANMLQAGLDLAPEETNAREMFEYMVRQIRQRVWE